jgi:hypothetical protein
MRRAGTEEEGGISGHAHDRLALKLIVIGLPAVVLRLQQEFLANRACRCPQK